MLRKDDNSRSKQPKYKENRRDRFARSGETFTDKRTNPRYVPYVAKKDEPKTKAMEETTIWPRFRVPCIELIGMAEVVNRLKFPVKIDRFLGSRRYT